MNTVKYIRKHVFKVRQDEFAHIAGVVQATVSKWESGTLFPDFKNLVSIRTEALSREIEWKDEWFFVAPDVIATLERKDVLDRPAMA